MRSLYPEIEPFSRHSLSADGHKIYFEESGNRDGLPVVFIHGGPGSGSNENHRRYFHPKTYRIINFDQRGCNRSTPVGRTEANTTWDLVEDLESIRQQLEIDKWMLFGGSWGATLGLLYAEKHPERVRGMVLRGTFLARKRDLDWFIYEGASHIFPDYWQEFASLIPEAEQDDLVQAYYNRLHGEDQKAKEQAALAWSTWAGRIVTYLLKSVDPDNYKPANVEQTVNEVLIETHYAKNAYFISENQILDDAQRLPEVPVIIIHGRRDLTCTVDASWSLHQQLPGSNLHIVKEGGHLAGEEVMVDALVTATDKMAMLLLS